jgi:outer membrane protein assembly factor BamB
MDRSTAMAPTRKPLQIAIHCCCAWSFFVLTIFALTTACSGQGFQQFAPASEQDVDATQIVLATPDNDLLRHLKAARRLLAQERFIEAVELLDKTLGQTFEQYTQDYFVPTKRTSKQTSDAYYSLRGEVRNLIGKLPTKGRDAYETKYGTKAKKLLSAALRSGDSDALEAIARRYYHTHAGYQATLLIGRRLLNDDSPTAAIRLLHELSQSPQARRQLEPHLSSLLAAAHARVGQNREAESILAKIRKQLPRIQFMIGGKRLDDASWLKTIQQTAQHTSVSDDTEWPVYLGNRARAAIPQGGTPLLSSRWHVDLAGDPTVSRLLQQRSQQYLDAEIPVLPAMHPIVIGNTLLVRTLRELVAIDMRSGRRVWYTQQLGAQSFEKMIKRDNPLENTLLNEQTTKALDQRAWDDMVFGTLSCDDQRVYAIEGMPLASNIRNRVSASPFNNALRNWSRTQSHNQLTAYRLDSQGKRAWSVGGETGGASPELAGIFFLGPPLPVADRLYAIAESHDEIRLVVLSPHDGHVLWSQQLAVVEQGITHPSQRLRRLVGATPSYFGGVLICPTSAGAVVAVDVIERSLLWAHQYRREEHIVASRAEMISEQMASEGATRWIDSTATIVGDRLFVTPVGTDDLLCIRMTDGKLLWKSPRGDGIYVACAQDGKVIVVGRQHIKAWNLADGKPATWRQTTRSKDSPYIDLGGQQKLPAGSMPSGRGYYSDGHYFLPLSSAEIIKIRLSDGAIVQQIASLNGVVPGNLICASNQVISQSFSSLHAFSQREPMLAQAQLQLKNNPDDAQALAALGEVQLADGNHAKALDYFHRAYQHKAHRAYQHKASLRLRQLLVTSLLRAVESDYASVVEQSELLASLINDDQNRATFLRYKADGLRNSGKTAAALAIYLELLDAPTKLGELESAGDHLSVRRERWIAPRLKALYDAATPTQRKHIDDQLNQRWASLAKTKSLEKFRAFITAVDGLPAANVAKETLVDALARSALPDKTLLERELLLRELAASHAQAGKSTAWRARMVENIPANHWTKSKDSLEGKDWPAGAIDTRVTRNRQRRSRVSESPYGEHEVMPIFSLPLVGKNASVFRKHNFSIDPNTQDLIIRDGLGQKKLSISLGEPTQDARAEMTAGGWGQASARGHLLMVACGDSLYALDTLQPKRSPADRILWQRRLTTEIPGAPGMYSGIETAVLNTALGSRRVITTDDLGRAIARPGPVTKNGIVYQQAKHLICADPLTGKPHWIREDLPAGCEIWADDQHVVVVPPSNKSTSNNNATEAWVLRGADGKLLAKRQLPRIEEHVLTNGCNLVTWSRLGDDPAADPGLNDLFEDERPGIKRRLTIHHLVTGKTRHFDFPGGAKAWPVDDHAIAVITPSGEFSLKSLPTGDTLLEHQLPAETNLTGIHVQATDEHVFLAVHRPGRKLPRGVKYATPESTDDWDIEDYEVDSSQFGSGGILTSGRIYAFDRSSKKFIWQAPVEYDHYLPIQNQPADIPLLVLVRRKIKKHSNGGHVTGVSLRCLDRRTGQVVYSTNSLPDDLSKFSLTASADRSTIAIDIGSSKVRLTYTDKPTPPGPPAQRGDRAYQPKKPVRSNVFSSLGNAFGRALGGPSGLEKEAERRRKLLEED